MPNKKHITDQIYVVTKNGGGTKSTDECIIFAHGGYREKNDTFPAPVPMLFYCPDRHRLGRSVEPLLKTDVKDAYVRRWKFDAAADCPNYDLSKAPGHDGITVLDTDIEGWVQSGEVKWDVIGVRYRWHTKFITLKKVLDATRDLGYKYTQYHLCHCRSLDGSDPKWRCDQLGDKACSLGAKCQFGDHRIADGGLPQKYI